MPKENRVLTGTKGLDELLEGGVPRGNCFLLQGPPGNEKGILARQYVKTGLESGEGVLVVLSEMSVEDFRRGMMALGLATQKYEKSGALHIIDWYTHKHSHIKGIEMGKGSDCSVIRTNVDLSNLGIALNKAMDAISKSTERRAMFDIMSQALFSFGKTTTYNFVQTTVAKCREHEVTAMFILEAAAHEPSVLHVLQQAFDGQIEISKRGSGAKGPAKLELCVQSMSGASADPSYVELVPDGKGLKVVVQEGGTRTAGDPKPETPAKKGPMGGRGIMALVSRAKAYAQKDEAERKADFGELDGIVKGFLADEKKEDAAVEEAAEGAGADEEVEVVEAEVVEEDGQPEGAPDAVPEPVPEPEPGPGPGPAVAPSRTSVPAIPSIKWSRPEGTNAFCPMCDKPVGITDLECPHCGMNVVETVQVIKCSDCDGEVTASDILCPHCGAMFDEENGVADAGGGGRSEARAKGKHRAGADEDAEEDVVGSEAVLIRLRPWGAKGFSIDWIRALLEKDVELANKEATVFISRAKEVERLEAVVKKQKDKASMVLLEDIRRGMGSPENSRRLGVEWKIIELKNKLKIK